MRWVVVLVCCVSCGRIGFDPISGASDDTLDGDSGIEDLDAMTVAGVAVPLSTIGECPALAWSGDRVGVVWRDGSASFAADVKFATFDTAGTMLDGPLTIATALQNVECPAIVWSGRFVVAVAHGASNRDIDVGIADITAAPLANIVNDAGDSTAPALVLLGNQTVLVWNDHQGATYSVKSIGLNPFGVANTAASTISGLTSNNGPPSGSRTLTGFAITWATTDGAHYRTLDGTAVADALEVSLTSFGSVTGHVAATWTGSDVQAVWNNSARTSYTSVRFEPNSLNTIGPFTAPAPSSTSPAIAWTGSSAAFAYQEFSGTVQIHLATMSLQGAVVSDVPVANASSASNASLTWAGDRFAVGYINNLGAYVKFVVVP